MGFYLNFYFFIGTYCNNSLCGKVFNFMYVQIITSHTGLTSPA